MKLFSSLALSSSLLLTQLAAAIPAPSPPCNVSSLLDPNQDRLGAVASESTECTQIGIDTLAQGGNAADAMVATVFCVGVIGMYHSGIGGGGFMTVRAPNGTYEFSEYSERHSRSCPQQKLTAALP
jgi:gamma-glutamyltranspeptidase/glutathione hydrolase